MALNNACIYNSFILLVSLAKLYLRNRRETLVVGAIWYWQLDSGSGLFKVIIVMDNDKLYINVFFIWSWFRSFKPRLQGNTVSSFILPLFHYRYTSNWNFWLFFNTDLLFSVGFHFFMGYSTNLLNKEGKCFSA